MAVSRRGRQDRMRTPTCPTLLLKSFGIAEDLDLPGGAEYEVLIDHVRRGRTPAGHTLDPRGVVPRDAAVAVGVVSVPPTNVNGVQVGANGRARRRRPVKVVVVKNTMSPATAGDVDDLLVVGGAVDGLEASR